MDSDSKLLFYYIPLATIVFLTAMLVYQHQQTQQVENLKSQLKTAKQAAVAAPVTVIGNNPTKQTQNSTPEEISVTPPNQDPFTVAPETNSNAQNSPASHIADDDKQIAAVRTQLANLQQGQLSIDDRSGAFKKQQTASTDSQKLAIDEKIALITHSMNELDQRLKTMAEDTSIGPPEVPLRELRAQRVDLQNQLVQLNLQKSQLNAANLETNSETSNEAVAAKDNIRAQQADLRQKLIDLQDDRDSWVKKQSDQQRNLQAQ